MPRLRHSVLCVCCVCVAFSLPTLPAIAQPGAPAAGAKGKAVPKTEVVTENMVLDGVVRGPNNQPVPKPKLCFNRSAGKATDAC